MNSLGVVSTVDPLASSAGREVLESGGNAVDAAIAAGAVLAVVAPHLCGLGGDLYALVHIPGEEKPACLNATGRAGSGADAARMREEGHSVMPFRDDIRATPVPGCVDGWVALNERFGTLPMKDLLDPARRIAAEGFEATGMLARAVKGNLAGTPGAEDLWRPLVSENGDSPAELGRRMARPGVARILEAVAAEGRDGFYRGEFGRGLIAMAKGEFTEADLERFNADWVEPLSLDAFGARLWTAPPNSQGYLALAGLGIAERLAERGLLPDDPDDGRWAHAMAEAARVAGFDRPEVLFEDSDVSSVLESLDERASWIREGERAEVPGVQAVGGTTALAAADRDGMAVSYIQSNAAGFGTHVFEPATGVGLQNRGTGFTLAEGHRAEYAPGRRPPHTLVPFLATDPETRRPRLVATTMGGDSQPQIVMQLAARVLHHGQSAAEAMWAPRWRLHPGTTGFGTWGDAAAPRFAAAGASTDYEVDVDLESGAPEGWGSVLSESGHEWVEVEQGSTFGHAHVIDFRNGGVQAAADPRSETGTVSRSER
ncbi:gamma-glutamyltransferase family protein [Salininema proteolyticum]|uniref:Gamma-glutamyltransferase family protein n=1 Tax=Salininema proteolyticum TaxID=1607685 RepID=A0ABV8U4S8_9ACTN